MWRNYSLWSENHDSPRTLSRMVAEEMKREKTLTKHPYAAIEHRVIDNDAYADLTYSARSLLILIARQLTKNNNGHLQATFSYMRRFRVSENTLSRAIRELISHGMIYRSRSGGYQQGAAQYAVTWLSITNKKGLFLDGFVYSGWRYWEPSDKKLRPPKLRSNSSKNGKWTYATTPKIEVLPTPIFEDIELMPCRGKFLWHPAYEIKAPSITHLAIASDRCQEPVIHLK